MDGGRRTVECETVGGGLSAVDYCLCLFDAHVMYKQGLLNEQTHKLHHVCVSDGDDQRRLHIRHTSDETHPLRQEVILMSKMAHTDVTYGSYCRQSRELH